MDDEPPQPEIIRTDATDNMILATRVGDFITLLSSPLELQTDLER